MDGDRKELEEQLNALNVVLDIVKNEGGCPAVCTQYLLNQRRRVKEELEK